tara:strand:+ start:1880 stop:2044 length:165 start_codon:yes stop_codon:yes gene_type:complete
MSFYNLGTSIVNILRRGSVIIGEITGTFYVLETQIDEQAIITDDGSVIHGFSED